MRTATIALKPAGGYLPIRSAALMGAWEWHQCGLIRLAELRIYFACLEMAQRRRGLERTKYDIAEITTLTGVKRPKPALRRLEQAGLLSFSDHAITFPDAGGRLIPFPRRMLRHLARFGHASLIATALGHMMRCLWLKGRPAHCETYGRVKASQVAEAFGLDVRRVKAARAELVNLGWLVPEKLPQWALNRHGGGFRVNLRWSGSKKAPPRAPKCHETTPPDSDLESPPGKRDQNPSPTGVSIRDVQTADLKDTARTLELHDQAVAQGVVTCSEADRLRVVAAAEHAMAVGKNPPALFVSLITNGWWKFLTQDDEDAARLRIKKQLYPVSEVQIGRSQPQIGGFEPQNRGFEVSEDTKMARAAVVAARQVGYKADPFHILRRKDPTWTRERWDAALRA